MDESEIAEQTCKQLHLNHQTIRLPEINKESLQKTLMNFYTESALPCGDASVLSVLSALTHLDKKNLNILDGMGNDIYVGHVPSRNDRLKSAFSFGNSLLFNKLKSCLRFDSDLTYFLQSRAENSFPGKRLSPKNLELILDTKNPYLSTKFWINETKQHKNLDNFDFRAYIRGRHYDQNESMLKTRLAASLYESTAYFPFCSKDFIDYYFNLSEHLRFDRKTYTNKIFIRNLLKDRLGYNSNKIGKKIFGVDSTHFFKENKGFILNEIENCSLLSASTTDICNTWIKKLDRQTFHYQAVFAILSLSGWYNNSKYLKK